MNQYKINLLDLPNEILLIILKKLDNMDVLYSLFDLNNERLDKIIQENTFTNNLNFVLITLTDDVLSISDSRIDRFCKNILPKIYYNVKSLILNSLSMERILFAADYPNLNKLKIFNFNDTIVLRYFTIKSPFRHIFRQHIIDLILVFENNFSGILWKHYTTDVYKYILRFFKNLKHLSITGLVPESFSSLVLCNLSLTTFHSSTLHKLSIHVMFYDDLLALLDGRLKQLNTLNVVIINREYNSRNVYNMNNLPDLKCFYLQYDCNSDIYYNHILPLLRHMSNIEQLNLLLIFENQTTFINGKHIYDEIIVHMSRLRIFNFCFCTFMLLCQSIDHLSKDDILETFSNNIYQQVDCMIRYRDTAIKYHVFSLPFMFDYLPFIDNKFLNIIFNHVIRLEVDDGIPFEHEFFMRISLSFPSLKLLRVLNLKPQTSISSNLSSNDNQLHSTIIEFPYLTSLNLLSAHDDYVDQFLNDKKARLPCLTKLAVSDDKLRIVTKEFTNERTRLNCMKVKQLNLGHHRNIDSEDFRVYFPLL
ncbi:unnamed protein product [Rotaria sp. Silwood1]|nr:unnamed protein product [Rotaria sp. Silwood1]